MDSKKIIVFIVLSLFSWDLYCSKSGAGKIVRSKSFENENSIESRAASNKSWSTLVADQWAKVVGSNKVAPEVVESSVVENNARVSKKPESMTEQNIVKPEEVERGIFFNRPKKEGPLTEKEYQQQEALKNRDKQLKDFENEVIAQVKTEAKRQSNANLSQEITISFGYVFSKCDKIYGKEAYGPNKSKNELQVFISSFQKTVEILTKAYWNSAPQQGKNLLKNLNFLSKKSSNLTEKGAVELENELNKPGTISLMQEDRYVVVLFRNIFFKRENVRLQENIKNLEQELIDTRKELEKSQGLNKDLERQLEESKSREGFDLTDYESKAVDIKSIQKIETNQKNDVFKPLEEFRDDQGNVYAKIERIQGSDINMMELKQKYNISLLGFDKNSNIKVTKYEKTTDLVKRTESIEIEGQVLGSNKFTISTKGFLDSSNNRLERNKVTMISSYKKADSEVKRTVEFEELFTYFQDNPNQISSKIIKIQGNNKATKLIYDELGREIEKQVGEIKSKKFEREFTVFTKEYKTEGDNKIIIERNDNDVITQVTVNGEIIAGLFGISLKDIIGSKDIDINLQNYITEQNFSNTLSDRVLQERVSLLVEKYIRDKISEKLNLDLESFKKSMTEEQIKQFVDDMVNEVYVKNSSEFNNFIQKNVEEYIALKEEQKNIKSEDSSKQVALNEKSQAAQRKRKEIEKKRKEAQDKVRSDIKAAIIENYENLFNNYLFEQKAKLVSDYISEYNKKNTVNRIVLEKMTEGLVNKYFEQAKKAKLEKLINQAYKDRVQEIKNAGDLSVTQFNENQKIKEVVIDKSGTDAPVVVIEKPKLSFLDELKKNKNKKASSIEQESSSSNLEKTKDVVENNQNSGQALNKNLLIQDLQTQLAKRNKINLDQVALDKSALNNKKMPGGLGGVKSPIFNALDFSSLSNTSEAKV